MNVAKSYVILADPERPEIWAVKLLDEKWNGIILSYSNVKMNPSTKSNYPLRLTFDTDIIYVPDRFRGIKFPNSEHVEYTNMLGKILFDIINSPEHKFREVDGKLQLHVNPSLPKGFIDALDKIKSS